MTMFGLAQPGAYRSSSRGPVAAGETHLCEEMAAELRRGRLSANRECLREPAGSPAIETNEIMTALPRPRTKRRIACAPMQPVGGLDYGGPAVMEPVGSLDRRLCVATFRWVCPVLILRIEVAHAHRQLWRN